MRLFVSIELQPEIIQEIIRIQKELKKLNLFEGTYVRPENLHITLAFFGSVEDEKIPIIHERLSSLLLPACDIHLTGLGVNSLSRPHVLWITIDSPLLYNLAHAIGELFPEYAEQRAFNAHITIARMKKVFSKQQLREFLTALPIAQLRWQTGEFSLWQSETFPEGPVYTLIAQYPLLRY